MSDIFSGLFDTTATSVISVSDFLLCVGVALVLGLLMALVLKIRTTYTKSFIIALALLPAIVCVVIMMVNGNIGAGVAVAGAFSLVRFRSMAGDAKQIVLVFLSMGVGLIAGMGYLAYAALFAIIMCIITVIYTALGLGSKHTGPTEKVMKILIPEDLDYNGVFDDIFDQYTNSRELVKVATSNMGSMYKLTYDVTLKDGADEKAMIDQMRCRNGNLEISIARKATESTEL